MKISIAKLVMVLGIVLFASAAYAQHHHTDSTAHAMAEPSSMPNAFSRNLPMNRNGSGTGWLPDNSPMYGYMYHRNGWMFMLHGNAFLRYNSQDIGNAGIRGDDKVDLPNWFMWMGQKTTGERGLFRFSTMISLDPLTVGGEGYPLLFQTGETWEGVSLVDRQHPHDLFTELSVAYSQMISEKIDLFGYLALPGEPAFGPVAFMHRVSGLYNPDAPIGHHWQDATHITFGVGTLGLRYGALKLEGSLFTGREPNEERFGIDRPRFDSWSARLSLNPSAEWALQVSKARVQDVHELGPREDVDKTSASVLHSVRFRGENLLNTAAVWGYNKSHHGGSHSFLLESVWQTAPYAVYLKYERVQKSTGELLLNEEVYGHDTLFEVSSVTMGLHRDLIKSSTINLALGAQGTLYMTPEMLQPLYGRSPAALELFLRVYPGMVPSLHSLMN